MRGSAVALLTIVGFSVLGLASEAQSPAAAAAVPRCNGLIAFASNRGRDLNPEIYALSLDGRRMEVSKSLGYGRRPEPSPDGTKLAFWSSGGLVVTGTGGADPRKVVFPANTYTIFEDSLVWAPDSRQFTIGTANSGSSAINIVDASTGTTTVLDSGRDVHWSPDGSEIAFLDNVPGGGQWVFVERRDGTGRRQLVPANSLEAWSPDGTRLLVNLGDTRIVPANGGNPLEIQNFGGIAWTPDGSRIIGYDSREQLESISADGTDARRIAGAASSATLSPDGRRLAFERQSDSHVVVTDLDGGGVQDLGPWDAGARDLHMQFEPRWSPDSTRVVYWSGGKIIVADADSGQTHVIAGGPGLTTDQPIWSADGSSVLDTLTDTNDNTDIYVAQPDGSHIRRVFADPLPEGGPIWSPNGKQLAFIRYGSPPSLIVIDLAGHTHVLLRPAALVSSLSEPPLSLDGSGWPAPPTWSPDGKRIAVDSSRGVLSVDVRTGAVRQLNIFGAVAWSKNGTTAYTDGADESFIWFTGKRGAWKLRVGDFQDSQYPEISDTPVAGIAYNLAWSPDGTKLAFTRGGAESGTGFFAWIVDTIRIVDTRTHRVSTFPASLSDSGFAWSPDGHYLIQGGMDAEISRTTGRHVAWLRGLRAFHPSWQPLCGTRTAT
jgi:TolB protein